EVVIAAAADQHIIARATEKCGWRQRAVRLIEVYGIDSSEARRLNLQGVSDGRRAAGDRNGAVVDKDISRGVAAHGDRIVARVAADRKAPRGKVCRDCHCAVSFSRTPSVSKQDGRRRAGWVRDRYWRRRVTRAFPKSTILLRL